MKGAVEVAIDAARAAGRIQRERSRDIGQIDYKESRADPVTEVDLLCEREIIRRIKEKFPDHDILAEESGTREGGASPSRWLIDPLDGTLNYAHGYPCYCASVALEHEGEVIVGVVYNPCLDELFVAEKGKGATLNSETLSVSTVSSLQNSFLVTGFAPTLREALNLNLIHFSNFMRACQAVRRPGSAAMDLCYTAMGRFDGFWEMRLNPWDTAAGALMVEEAGGKVTTFDGGPFHVDKKEILATNGRVHDAMVGVLQKGNPEPGAGDPEP